MDASTIPEPPVYAFNNAPHKRRKIAHANVKADSELGDRNLARWVKWCPDGSAALCLSEDRVLRLYDTPDSDQSTASWQPALRISQPSATFSALWYPTASRHHPATYCFLAGGKDAPIKLIDGSSGRVRASYTIFDHTERFVAPSSMAFNPDATKLYCGFDSSIEVFDFLNPGTGTSERLKLRPSRKSRDGQRGLISALAFSTDRSGLYAAGSFSGNVSFYHEDQGETRVAELELGEKSAGITQLAFHPTNPCILFSASRMSNHIAAYDIRNLSEGPICRLDRPGRTQQRITFDLDWAGRYLVTGDTTGCLRAYDVTNGIVQTEAIYSEKVAGDVVCSTSLHPFKPWVLTSVGSRRTRPERYRMLQRLEVEESDESDPGSDSDSDDESSDGLESGDEEAATAENLTAAGGPNDMAPAEKEDSDDAIAVDQGLLLSSSSSTLSPADPIESTSHPAKAVTDAQTKGTADESEMVEMLDGLVAFDYSSERD